MVRCQNVDEFVYAGVISGDWKQHEVWDGTYTLDDLLDLHEILAVKAENQARAQEAREEQ